VNESANTYLPGGKISQEYGRFQQLWTDYRFEVCQRFFIGDTAIEMGLADGQMTRLIAPHYKTLWTLEGSKQLIKHAKGLPDNVKLVHTFFEDYTPKSKVDMVLMSHVLEHVDDPVALLTRAAKWLNQQGRLIIMVPNADSLHRQVGVKMGIIPEVTTLDSSDHSVGHQRVYTWASLQHDISQAGLKVAMMGGMFLKSLSNSQIEQAASDEAIIALFRLGEEYPRMAAEMYAMCEL
jgi:trans-aconitate methyltransferase